MEHGPVYKNPDSYCGPISMLMRMPDDELLIIFREAKWRGTVTHADPTTRASLLRSRDRGRSWFSHISPDPAGGNGTSIARMADGTLLASAFHWLYETSGRPAPQGGKDVVKPTVLTGVFVTRSLTEGYTWEPAAHVPEPDGSSNMSCAGAILELPGGDLLLPLTARRAQMKNRDAVVMRSRDRGRSWGEPVCLTADADPELLWSETRLVLCPSGRILAMHRSDKGNYFRNISNDGGLTWSATEDTGIWCGGSSPPDLLRLADGRILLSRGHRRAPFGVRCNLSTDEGLTWGPDIILRDDASDRDVGYPSTIQFSDGALLTAYYWHGEDGIRHLQRTSWNLV